MVSRKCAVVPKVKSARAPGNALGMSSVKFWTARAALRSGACAAAARDMSALPVVWIMMVSRRKMLSAGGWGVKKLMCQYRWW